MAKKAAAPAAPAAPPAPAPGPGPINVKPPGPAMVGEKTAAQVRSETDAAIKEALAEAAAEDAGGESPELAGDEPGEEGKGKSEEEGSESEASRDDEDKPKDEDEDEGEGEDDEEPKDGKKLTRRQLKKRARALDKRERGLVTREQQVEKDAQLLDKLFGKSLQARRAAQTGDSEAVREAIEATLIESTGMGIDDAIVFLADPSKAKTPEQIELARIRREREQEKRERERLAAQQARQAEEQKAITWIKSELKSDPIAKLPGFERVVLQTMIQRYNDGAKTPKKAARMALEQLQANYEALSAVFGGASAPRSEPEEAPAERPRGRGSPPRENAVGRAPQDARPPTTGDIIAEVMVEERLWKPSDRRVAGLRGKRVGAA
jgi:hypothetical protein